MDKGSEVLPTHFSATSRHVPTEQEKHRATLHLVESLALVLLCSCKPIVRKLAVITLKEVRNLFACLGISKVKYCITQMLLGEYQ